MHVVVVGLGKIGLPLAVQIATAGNTVIGCDVNPEVVEKVNQGIAPFLGEADLPEKLKDVVNTGLLTATVETTLAVRSADAIVVVVPVFLNDRREADFSLIDSAVRDIALGLKKGALVSFETTLPVGTTRDRLTPQLEDISGLTRGADFSVVFSPERVYSGRVFEDLRRYPKLIGGIDSSSTAAGIRFYEQFLEFDARSELFKENGVWNLGSCESAELAKLAETTYRDVNIALANTFAVFAMRKGINVNEVIRACNSQPFSHIHTPGISVGGHCIPVYPEMYLEGHSDAQLVRVARELNLSMPELAVDALESQHGTLINQKVLVMGVSYRGGVKEHAYSGIFQLSALLNARQAVPYISDPLYGDDEIQRLGLNPSLNETHFDTAIIHTDHERYKYLKEADFPSCKTILDGRDILDQANFPNIKILKINGSNIHNQ